MTLFSFVFLSLLSISSFAEDVPRQSYLLQAEERQEQLTNLEEKKEDLDKLTDLYSNLEEVIDLNMTCKKDKDCETVAIGINPCGRPYGYAAVSKRNIFNFWYIEFLAKRITKEQFAFNLKYPEMGMCSYETKPQATCVAETCNAKR